MDFLNKEEVCTFKENGFLRIENVFSKDEIAIFREQLIAIFNNDIQQDSTKFRLNNYTTAILKKDMLVHKEIRDFMLDDRVLAVAKDIIGETPVYFGFSKLVITFDERSVKPHRDNFSMDDWADDYGMVRVGLYLQDHSKVGGDLWVYKGSHKGKKKGAKIPTRATGELGSLVVWDMRAKHCVSTFSKRKTKDIYIPYVLEAIYHRINKIFIPTNRKKLTSPRIYLHLLFCKNDAHLQTAMKKIAGPKKDGFWTKEQMRNTNYGEDEIKIFGEKNMSFVNLSSKIV